MSGNVVDVYNWALAAVGTRGSVQAVDEASVEAEICTLFYENVRDQILRSAPWDCAKAYRRLGLSVENDFKDAWVETDPPPNWRFAYVAPSDYIWPRFISTMQKFEVGLNSNNQRMIYTNQEQPVLCYTKRLTRVDLWDADLQAAVGYALGAHICMKVTGSENRVRTVTAQAIDKIIGARTSNANAPQNPPDEVIPEWIAARSYGDAVPARPYIYPSAEFAYGGLSSATS